MSQVRTYLTIVLLENDEGDLGWIFELPLDAQQAIDVVSELGIHSTPARLERHYSFELLQPLTQGQLWGLEQLKKRGNFDNFYVRDEISPDDRQQGSDEVKGGTSA